MPKQFLSKTFTRLFFAIFLIGSLFSLLGIGKVEVKAATTSIEYKILKNEGFIGIGGGRYATAIIYNDGSKRIFLGLVDCSSNSGSVGTATKILENISKGAAAGGTGGVITGATVGTIVPGTGTVVGAVVFGAIGTLAGAVSGAAGSAISPQELSEINSISCSTPVTALKGVSYGKEYNGETELVMEDNGLERDNGNFVLKDKNGDYYISGTNGVYIYKTKNSFEKICPTGGNDKSSECTRYLNETRANLTSTQSASDIIKAGLTGGSATIESDAIARSMNGNGAICRSNLDSDKKAVYYCTKSGKPTGPNGDDKLIEKCKTNETDGRIYFRTSDEGKTITCVEKVEAEKIKNDSVNKPTENSTTTKQEDSNKFSEIDPIGGALGVLFNIILTVISFIILALTYFAGWLAIGALWILGYLFLIFLRINPAGANFISVAVDPWRIVVGIANMFVLSTFIFVGFGYILDIAKLKVKIEDFLLKIIVFTLILNFTLLGSASIVNVTQGIGEIMVGAYSIGETDPQKANFALINGLIEGMSRASVLRCGNIEWASPDSSAPKPAAPKPTSALAPGEKAPPSASENATGKDCDFGLTGSPGQFGKLIGTLTIGSLASVFGKPLTVNGKAGSIVSITIMELVFLAIACFAVVQFWKALALVLGRTIGLWLLIVASPLALAAYISPIEGLKKYASQWLDHFWKWCLFYPCFIFCLILINIMSRSFADAANVQVNNLANNTNGIITSAANEFTIGGVDAINLMLFAILGVVPMFLLSATVDYFAKSFEAIAKMTLGAAKQAWTGFKGAATGFKGAATIMGGGISGVATKLGNSIDSGKLGDWGRKNAANRSGRIQSEIKTQDDIINGVGRTYSSAEVIEAERKKAGLLKDKEKADADSKGRFSAGLDYVAKGGDAIAMAPLAAEYAIGQAKYNLWDRFATGNKAAQASYKEKLEGAAELRARAKAKTQKEAEEIDKNPAMRRFKGVYNKDIEKNGMKFYEDQIRGNADQASQGVWGTDKLNISQQTGLDRTKEVLEEYGENYADYTPEQKQTVRELLVLASKNGAVAATLLNNKKGKDMLRFFQDELSQEVGGQEALDKLLKEYPDANKESAQFAIGQEIGSKIAANPNDPTIPKNITEDKILEGIGTRIPLADIKKRYGGTLYDSADTSNSFYSNAKSGNANLQTTEEQMSALQSTVGTITKAQFTQSNNFKNRVIDRIKGHLERNNGSISDAEAKIIIDDEAKEAYKNEFGTDKIGEENFDDAVTEIFAKFSDGTNGESLLQTGLGKKLAKDVAIKKLLDDPTTRSEGLKLVAQSLAGALKSANIRQPLFNQTQGDNAKLYAEGQYRGEQAAVAPSLEFAQIKTTRSAATTPEELRSIVALDSGQALRNTFGTTDVTESIREGVVNGKKIDGDLGLRDQNIFTKMGSVAERNSAFTKITNAITEAANQGIEEDGSGGYRFTNPSAIAALNTGTSPIDINQADLAKKIVSKGQFAVQKVLQSDDVGAALDGRSSKAISNIGDIHKGTMYDANVADENFVSSSGSPSPSTGSNVRPTPQSMPNPADVLRNNIVNFRSRPLPNSFTMVGITGIDNDGYLINASGDRVDINGQIADPNNPFATIDPYITV